MNDHNRDITIGILGGMGTYATIHAFQQYAEVFEAQKEWERPRLIIDNRCTMPSRVRAFLYNEKVPELVSEIKDSLCNMANGGCNRLILGCNTAHLFLPMVYEKAPDLELLVVNVINTCVEKIVKDNVDCVYLLASEGTIESNVYNKELGKFGIKCISPEPNEYELLRYCIEAVKQNDYSNKIRSIFLGLINRHENCILGCTELPVLYCKYKKEIGCSNVYDPLLLSLMKIKKEVDNG